LDRTSFIHGASVRAQEDAVMVLFLHQADHLVSPHVNVVTVRLDECFPIHAGMGAKAIEIGLREKDIPRLNPATIDAACYAGELQAFIVKPTHLYPFFTMTNKGLPRRRRPPIGERRIRTFEGDNQQIYSLPPLAAWVPLPVKRQTYNTSYWALCQPHEGILPKNPLLDTSMLRQI
jgi:hypothetical protein